MHIKYTDGKAIDGTTVWDSAREDNLRNDISSVINGNIDGTNISDGAITRAKMASGNQDVVQAITITMSQDVILTNRVGVTAGTGAEYSGAVTAKTDGTIVAVDYSALIVDTSGVVFKVNVAGSDVAATAATMSTSVSAQTAEVDGLSVSVSDGNPIKISFAGSGGTTNVVDPIAVVYLKRRLA
tara:strand:- start:16106 stop:16657 length:552 start_codon:yes stop_codon:yes gene_type:complete